ncbi:MAG TPA: DinB family protein [Candidatus Saccharimonadales bacterium]|jgi:hypothetical protein|nr:DinB family protein [Candidatus Saccharimonadales bacterium]
MTGPQSPASTAAAVPAAGQPEPWLRGTHQEVAAAQRAVLHALELAEEDLQRWCGGMLDDELNARPAGLPPLAFHLRHIPRSIDRLLTYAEGNQLAPEQIAAMKTELDSGASGKELFLELRSELRRAATRIRAFDAASLGVARQVGKKQMPATVGGLLVHVADHTQRHVGQAITTAKVVKG